VVAFGCGDLYTVGFLFSSLNLPSLLASPSFTSIASSAPNAANTSPQTRTYSFSRTAHLSVRIVHILAMSANSPFSTKPS
jgi:hypothetical protein